MSQLDFFITKLLTSLTVLIFKMIYKIKILYLH